VKQFADKALSFFLHLEPPAHLPKGIDVLFPYREPEVKKAMRSFFRKFFADCNERYLLVGINPGRFGAGITGINFTAPLQLTEDCGIDHPFGRSNELSATFIYDVIRAYGGAEDFYARFYIAAMSPVGFTRNGKNMNYYDDPALQEAIRPYAVSCLEKELAFGFNRRVVICIGGGKNYRFLSSLNQEYHFFEEIIVVPHPRFIMQYRRSAHDSYVKEYLSALAYCLNK
jgi:hypothetical protein